MTSKIGITLFLILAPFACFAAGEQPGEESNPAPQDSTQEEFKESRWQLGIALGYGLRTNPLIQSDDIPIAVDVDIAWFGDHFFFDNGDFGLTFLDNDAVTTSVVARVNSDRVFFGKTNTKFVTVGLVGEPAVVDVQVIVPDRDYAIELGLELLADGRWGHLQLTAHHDVSGTHDGYEIDANFGYGWRNQRWYFEPSFGLSYKSEAMNTYYWGVRPNEASAALPVYTADAGINSHARLLFSYQMSKNWAFSLAGEFERLNTDAADSPIVADRNVIGYFAGFGFRF